MSLLGRNLGRIAKIAIFVAMAMVFPSQPANAVTYTNWTSINTGLAGTQNWLASAVSYNGNIMYAAAQYGYIYKSVDSGTTWSRLDNSGARIWNSIATNDSGTIIWAAPTLGGYLWLSTDSGATWTEKTSSANLSWTSIATSASGSTVVGVYGSTNMYFSANTGASFQAFSNVGSTANTVSISGDGTKVAIESNDGIYLGTYAASTFTFTSAKNVLKSVNSGNSSISLSRDGTKIVAIGGSNEMYPHTSTNFGSTWETATASPVGRGMGFVHLSGDGSKIMMTDTNGPAYISSDWGVTWTAVTSTASTIWSSLSSNYSGQYWVATVSLSTAGSSRQTGIYVSNNSGSSLVLKPVTDGSSNILSIDSSSDGSVIAALSSYGNAWISRDSGTTWSTASLANIGSQQFNCVSVSGDGSRIMIGTDSKLYQSSDSGNTFTEATTGIFTTARSVYSISMNTNGSKAALVIQTLGIYISVDSGANFNLSQGTSFASGTYTWKNITMTADGQKLAVGNNGGISLAISKDGGSTWSLATSIANSYTNAESSADGSVLIASANAGASVVPQVSRDWGSTWRAFPATPTDRKYTDGISISSDGSLIVAGNSTYFSTLYQSTDYGVTFTTIPGSASGFYNSVKVAGSPSVLLVGTSALRIQKATIVPPAAAVFSGVTLSTSNVAYRQQVTLTATVSTSGADGKATFKEAGKNIAGCVKVPTVSLVATCKWKPTKRGASSLTVTIYPTDSNYLSGSTTLQVSVGNRTGNR